MYWHTRTLYQNNVITIGQAIKFNLPAHGLMGSLILRFDGIISAGYGVSGGDWRIIDKISKIIVQHGSTPIVSVTGLEAHALAALDQNLIPPDTWRNYNLAQQWCYCLVNFGRYLNDPEMGLDLGAWDNTQLIIENTAVLGVDLNSLNVTVVGIMAEDPAPRQFGGYLSKLEWRSWPTVQNETIYSLLPEEDVIRRIVLQAIPPNAAVTFLATAAMYSEMYNVKLFFDTGRTEVYNDSIEMLMRQNLWNNYGYWISAVSPYQDADRGFDVGLGYVLGHAHGAGADNDAAAAVIPTWSLGFNRNTQKKEVSEANHPDEGLVMGMAPFCCAWINFDQDLSPLTWLDPRKRASVTLDIWTRNAALVAGGRNSIILDLYKPM